MPKITAATLEEHRAATEARLLDAWGELVMTRGYGGVSLADVAARAGVTRTTVYNYFPDRVALLFRWTDREVARTLEDLELALDDAGSNAERLAIFVRHELLSFTTSHLPPGREVVHTLGPEVFQEFMRHIEPVEQVLHTILEAGIADGEFVDADVLATVPLILACIGAERGPLSTGSHDLEDAYARVSTFVLRALGAAPTA